ncbi:MAG TPA: preprotein translocase subunit SecE [Gemmatimonadaceae bacterium]|nr:preprotein translocase subunit SecE [Gemmatimonadaceae bacterium]
MAVDVARSQGTPRGGTPTAPPPSLGWWARLVQSIKDAWQFTKDGFHEVRYKTTWPDRGQVRQATIAIIIFVLAIALLITLMDAVLSGLLVRLIPSLFSR